MFLQLQIFVLISSYARLQYMHQMRKKCFCVPIYGKQLRMIAIVVQMFFFI